MKYIPYYRGERAASGSEPVLLLLHYSSKLASKRTEELIVQAGKPSLGPASSHHKAPGSASSSLNRRQGSVTAYARIKLHSVFLYPAASLTRGSFLSGRSRATAMSLAV